MRHSIAAILLAGFGFVAAPLPKPIAPPLVPERRPFQHGGTAGHVRNAWFVARGEKELARDCKGCHSYPGRDQARDPQQLCERCHYGDSITIALAAEADPSLARGFRRELGRAFDHHDHGRMLDCRDCHLPDRGGRLEPIVVEGTASCFDCHDPGTASGQAAKAPVTLGAFILGLNSSLETAADPEARFRHAEHVAGPETNPETCLTCHGDILNAPGHVIGGREFALETCGACHKLENGGPVSFGIKTERFISRSDGTFPHGPHLSEKAIASDEKLREKGCLACHEPAVRVGIATYSLAQTQGDYYRTCVACHHHGQREIADHGEIDGCMGCHALETSRTNMATNRPQMLVQRSETTLFEFEGQAHPFIADEEDLESCRKCHLAEVRTLPSRLSAQRFSHDTHLPPEPEVKDCLACHPGVAGTSDSLSLGDHRYDADLTSCRECHRGSKIRAVPGPPVDIQVVRFPHDVHLRPAAMAKLAEVTGDRTLQDQACLACHVPPQNGAPHAGTLEQALACSACHDHEERAAITGGKDKNYVGQCQQCHVVGVPDKGVPVFDTRRMIEGTLARQWHPRESSCTTCHKVPPKRIVRQRSTESPLLFGEMRYPDAMLHNEKGRPEECADCHWADGFGDPARVKQSRPQLLELGRKLEGYPGQGR